MKTIITALLGSVLLVGAAHSICLSPACDFDGNGAPGRLPDYAIFLAAFGSKVGEAKYNPAVDFDSSGSITTADFAIMQRFCPLQQQ